MLKQIFLVLVAMLLAARANAFDDSNVGTYALIHKDGHVTDSVFFVSKANGAWQLEQRNKNGDWSNVTCERDCVLSISRESDIERFIPSHVRQQSDFQCIHNSAFAFCKYVTRADAKKGGFTLIALVTKTPTPIFLKKLSTSRVTP